MADDIRRTADILRMALVGLGTAQTLTTQAAEIASSAAAETARLRERASDLEAVVAGLEAILAGRATPPTDAEIEAHCARGGRWRTNWNDRMSASMAWSFAHGQREGDMKPYVVGGRMPSRWWALDAADRPCAWPVVDRIETKEE